MAAGGSPILVADTGEAVDGRRLLAEAVGFGRALRAAGLPVGPRRKRGEHGRRPAEQDRRIVAQAKHVQKLTDHTGRLGIDPAHGDAGDPAKEQHRNLMTQASGIG